MTSSGIKPRRVIPACVLFAVFWTTAAGWSAPKLPDENSYFEPLPDEPPPKVQKPEPPEPRKKPEPRKEPEPRKDPEQAPQRPRVEERRETKPAKKPEAPAAVVTPKTDSTRADPATKAVLPTDDALEPTESGSGPDLALRAGVWTNERRLEHSSAVGVASAKFAWEGAVGPGTLRGNGLAFGATGARSWAGADVRELNYALPVDDWKFVFGREILNWSRVGQAGTLERISGRDRTLFVADPDEERRGTGLVSATYGAAQSAGWRLSALWLPEFRPDRVPLPADALFVSYRERRPHFDATQFAARAEYRAGPAALAFTYFEGLDREADLRLRVPFVYSYVWNVPHLPLQWEYNRQRVLGADAAVPLGDFRLSAELAQTWTADGGGDNPFVKNPFFQAVAGGERTFFDSLSVAAHLIYRHVEHFRSAARPDQPLSALTEREGRRAANQVERDQLGTQFKLTQTLFTRALVVELSTIAYFGRGDYTARARLLYHFAEDWRVGVSGEVFGGHAGTYYQRFKRASVANLEVQYDF